MCLRPYPSSVVTFAGGEEWLVWSPRSVTLCKMPFTLCFLDGSWQWIYACSHG